MVMELVNRKELINEMRIVNWNVSTLYRAGAVNEMVVFKVTVIDAILKTRKRGQKTELTGRSPLRRQRCARNCSTT
jgi:hypothetical protein